MDKDSVLIIVVVIIIIIIIVRRLLCLCIVHVDSRSMYCTAC